MKRALLFVCLLLAIVCIASAQGELAITSTSPLPGADIGTPYSFTFAATGGVPPYTWSLGSGAPNWLNINGSTGVLSGTPPPDSQPTYNFQVIVTDSLISETTTFASFQIQVNPEFRFTVSSPLPEGPIGSPYTAYLSVTGGQAPYTWQVVSGSTQGLVLGPNGEDSAQALLSGTPTSSGLTRITLRVTDGASVAIQRTFDLPIASTNIAITNRSPMTTAEVGAQYSYSMTATGGFAPYTWSLFSSNTAPGLNLSMAGVLSGIPTQAGNYFYQPFVSDAYGIGTSLGNGLQLTVIDRPAITTEGLPSADAGSAYSFTFGASGGQTPYTWSAPSGLPAGLSLNATTGALTGTPPAAGQFGVLVQIRDALGGIVSGNFTLNVYPALSITNTSPLPEGLVGRAGYSVTFHPTGGVGEGYTLSIVSGSTLGLNFSQGVLSGTPTTAGSSTIRVQLSDGVGSIQQNFLLPVASTALTITNVSPLPTGEKSVPYTYTFTATGGVAPYTWSRSSDGPAPGLTLNPATGILSGTPTQAGTFSYIPKVTDAAGVQYTLPLNQALSLSIVGPATITSRSPLSPAAAGSPYTFTFAATGGQAPYTWSAPSNVPQGLTLNRNGTLSGVPTTPGQVSFPVTVTDALHGSATLSFSLTINSGLTITNTSPMPNADRGAPYSYTFMASGGAPPYTWSLGSSNPAPGLVLNPQTGVLSGTPTSTGTFSYLPQVTDALGYRAQLQPNAALSLTVVNGPSVTSTSPLPAGTVGLPYSFTFGAANGVPPYNWSVLSGTLPPGLSWNGSGSLQGTPTAAGSYNFTIQVRDSLNGLGTAAFGITINSGLTITTISPLPGAVVGAPYNAQFGAVGGQPPYTWSLAQGSSLPPGLSLSAAGSLTGTPGAIGTASFSVQLTDARGTSASGSFTFAITTHLTIGTQSPLPTGMVGTIYSLTFTSAGGTAPLAWSVASGTLPDGLHLDSASGALTGTPSATGDFPFAVKVTDATQQAAQANFTITIGGKLTITTVPPLPDGKTTVPYSGQLAATGGAGKLTWSIQSGTLPGGLALGATGAITGTPTDAGSFPFTVLVTDSSTPSPQTANRAFSITITPGGLTVTTSSLPASTAGSSYSAGLAATGGTQPYSWSANGLPSGLSLDPAGTISGTPKSAGSFGIGVTVTDAKGLTGSRTLTLTVALPQAPNVNVTNLPSMPAANQQPQFSLGIGQTYPLDISGQLQLTFTSPSGVDDPMIRFANGSRQLDFTIPANTSTPVFANGDQPIFLTGTTAGTITLTFGVYQAGGQDLQPVPPAQTVTIPAGPPVISSVTATRTTGGFQVKVTGFTTTRAVTAGRFHFGGTNLQTTDVSLTVDTLFNSWFQTTQSVQFGTQFTFMQTFNIQGDPQTVTSVTVTLSSSAGDSAPATAQLQ